MKLIETNEELKEAIASFSQEEYICIDTEFIREKSFWPELCLIQIASSSLVCLIDPTIVSLDLQPFFDLMSNEKVIKIFHAARQDIEIIFHKGKIIPSPLFDTQIVAMVCGFGEHISFEKLVFSLTKETIDKSSRFTNWRQRPLCAQQISYAIKDVTFLLKIYPYLTKELAKRNREDWIIDETREMIHSAMEAYNPETIWKRIKIHVQKPEELNLLRAIAFWREETAERKNIPRSHVMKDYVIEEIIRKKPHNSDELGQLRCIPQGWERNEDAKNMLNRIHEVLSNPSNTILPPPMKPWLKKSSSARIQLLKVFLQFIAEKEEVAAKMIAKTEDLEILASEGKDCDIPALKGWRFEIFGAKALKLLEGSIAFKIEKENIVFFDV